MSLSRRRTYRKEEKQISFFTSPEIHESIKLEAKRKNTSIKDYLVRLHINATNKNSQENLIVEMHQMIKRLSDAQAFLVVPQQQLSNLSTNLPTQMQSNDRSNSVDPLEQLSQVMNDTQTLHHQQVASARQTRQSSTDLNESNSGKIAYSDGLTFSPQLEVYLSGITRTNTYETMRKIIFALYKLKEATHYQINEEIGHTTHNQPRALKRAVEDRVILVDEPDNPKEPFYYRINPSYLQQSS